MPPVESESEKIRYQRYAAAIESIRDFDSNTTSTSSSERVSSKDSLGLGMFLKPVSDTEVPGYSDVIDEPMDLQTMLSKVQYGMLQAATLKTGQACEDDNVALINEEMKYDNDADFCDDLALMFANAKRFNHRDSAYYRHTKAVKHYAEKVLKKLGIDGSLTGGGESGNGSLHAEGADGRYIIENEDDLEDDIDDFARDQKKISENVKDTLSAMQGDLKLSAEELRKKYARPASAPHEKKDNPKMPKHADSPKKRLRSDESDTEMEEEESEDEEDEEEDDDDDSAEDDTSDDGDDDSSN